MDTKEQNEYISEQSQEQQSQLPNKIIGIIVIIIAITLLAWFGISPYKQNTQDNNEAEKQLQELKKVRAEYNTKPSTEEEKAIQLEELQKLRSEYNTKPSTKEERAIQLEELQRLRNNQ